MCVSGLMCAKELTLRNRLCEQIGGLRGVQPICRFDLPDKDVLSAVAWMPNLNVSDSETLDSAMGVAADCDNLLWLKKVNHGVKKFAAGIPFSNCMAPVRHRIIRLMWMQRKDVPEKYRFVYPREHPPDHVGSTLPDRRAHGCLLDGQPAEQSAVGAKMHFIG